MWRACPAKDESLTQKDEPANIIIEHIQARRGFIYNGRCPKYVTSFRAAIRAKEEHIGMQLGQKRESQDGRDGGPTSTFVPRLCVLLRSHNFCLDLSPEASAILLALPEKFRQGLGERQPRDLTSNDA
ncbi:hypothetical protein Cob_v010518 [Colletotrichum orbiculare MAFF 240422]|uniref:Uncharacterized protein n=1 Tax=Colletotrichum orbiculare (strain 104-T / ATCC 96160 / CBS 514.97 / LARS 414 / MAFF 240422) TaxID=1213857 RepID=A0A484FFK4_COLOR|nr:hypothetical protein Cob_v010518 [Colletotrichum orbiculare MAFF 240422]